MKSSYRIILLLLLFILLLIFINIHTIKNLFDSSKKAINDDLVIDNGVLPNNIGDNASKNTIDDKLMTDDGILSNSEGVGENTADDFVVDNGVLLYYKGDSENVIVPEYITAIGNCAFMNYTKMVNVTLPDKIIKIGDNAFDGCTELESIIIPDSVKEIGNLAFFSCSNLTSVSIPSSVTYIGYGAFATTPWLEGKREENTQVIINNILIDGVLCKGSVAIEKGVKTIAGEAFTFNKELTSITIPDSVTYIGAAAFIDCRYLVSVKMSDNVTELGASAFMNCIRLKSINLSGKLRQIEDSTFKNCKRLTAITIPYSVTKIYRSAFSSCGKLKYVTASDNVISDNEFLVFNKLTDAFVKCNSDLTIYSYKDSYLKEYTSSKKINYQELALSKSQVELSVGQTYELIMNSQALCDWKSSNDSIASVDSSGNVTAKGKGSAIITATLYGRKYECSITVKE